MHPPQKITSALTLILSAILLFPSLPHSDLITKAAFRHGPAPTTSLRALSHTSPTQQQPAFDYPLQYTSFSQLVYNLRAYDGRYVRYALPDTWTGPSGMTAHQIRKLVDTTDVLYTQFAEVTGAEPLGSGLLTIAIVPTGAMAGHAGPSFKGIELSDRELGATIQNLEADLITPELTHEMAHCFDRFTTYLRLGYSDSIHAWTSFLIPYMQYYTRAGILQADPDSLLQKKITEYTQAWDANPSATWTLCVRNGDACPNIKANNIWAGLLLRFARLHGPDTLKKAFLYLGEYASTHPATGPNPTNPKTPEAKNDLLLEALAEGAQQNILCELDAWRWFTTPLARERINRKFPAPNSICLDKDLDGFNQLQGDTDDTNSQINPTAAEAANTIDDDCDGIIDDLTFTENTDFPSSTISAPRITLTAKVHGHVTPSDVDTFILDNTTSSLPKRLRLNLQSPNTFVGYIKLQTVDLTGRTQSFSIAGGGAQVLTLTKPGLWALSVENSISAESDYVLTIEDAGSPTKPVRLKVVPGATPSTIKISATMDQNQKWTTQPTQVRYWLGSSGFVHTTPFQSQSIITLPIPSGAGPFSVRAQVLSSTSPLTKTSLPLWVDRNTGEMIDTTPDLTIEANTNLPAITDTGNSVTYGFTITNNGPGLAEGIDVTTLLPAGLTPISSATTLGDAQITGTTARLTIKQLGPTEATSFSVTAISTTAQGLLIASSTVSALTTDPDQSNNTASITGYFLKTATPIPTPTPTPLPTPTPSNDLQLQSLPAKAATAQSKGVLAAGGLARAIIITSANTNTDIAFEIQIADLNATIITATKSPGTSLDTYLLDFILPDNAPTGEKVPLTITQPATTSRWSTTAVIAQNAPALWAQNGTADGDLLAFDATLLTAGSSLTPFHANNTQRILVFASGAKTLAEQNALILRVRCPSGVETVLTRDYTSAIASLPGLLQIIFRIPQQLSNCGMAQLLIDGSQDNRVFLPIL